MHIRPTFLFLVLATITSFSYARDYVYTEDGTLRFYRGQGENNNDLHLEMHHIRIGWEWFHSYHIPYIGDPKPRWKQEYSSHYELRTYIEYPHCFERHSAVCDRRLILVEKTQYGRFRTYRSGYDIQFDESNPSQYKLKFEVFNQDSQRFETTSTIDMRDFSSFDLKLSNSGELLLNLLPYAGDWIPRTLLSASDVDAFK